MRIYSLLFTLAFIFSGSMCFAQNSFAAKAATTIAMENLKINSESVPVQTSLEITSTETSDRVSLTLHYPDLPEIRLFMSGPKGFLNRTDHSLPTLFLVAGFFTGGYNSLLLGEVSNMVIVSFDYPYPVQEIAQDAAKILQTFRVTPGLIALTLKWLSQQAWVNHENTVATGVSLGGLFLPAALKMAQRMNAAPPRTIFAFTGANIKLILANLLGPYLPPQALDATLSIVPSINLLNEPKLHLSALSGNFLVIRASDDQIIAPSTTQELWELLPETKTQVVLSGPHIDYDQNLQIQATKEAILNWLQ